VDLRVLFAELFDDRQNVQSEVIDRPEQARRVASLLKQRRFDPQLGMERTQIKQEHEVAVVDRLIELCEREIPDSP
jgi:hypothetical protein